MDYLCVYDILACFHWLCRIVYLDWLLFLVSSSSYTLNSITRTDGRTSREADVRDMN